MQTPSDWRAYQRGRPPRDFTARGDASATYRITGCLEDTRDRQWLAARAASNTLAALTWDGHDGSADQEWLLLIRPRVFSAALYVAGARIASDLSSGLFIALLPAPGGAGIGVSPRLFLYQRAASVETLLASRIPASPIVIDDAYFVRLRASGSTVTVRIWQESLVEPSSWDLTATTTVLGAGVGPGFALNGLTEAFDVLFWSAGTAGDSALGLSSLPRSLAAAVKQSRSAKLGTVLELVDVTHIDTLAVSSLYACSGEQADVGAADIIPPQSIRPSLMDAGTLSAQLNGDIQFGGEGIADPAQLGLKNDTGQSWQLLKYAIAGRYAVVRMGEIGYPLRYWEVVRSGTVSQEPSVSPDRAVIQISPVNVRTHRPWTRRPASPEGGINTIKAQLAQPIIVNIYSGLPVGLNFVTASAAVAVAYQPAYDMIDFTVVRRFRTGPLTGVGAAAIAGKGTGATWNFNLTIIQASDVTVPGQVQFFASSGGGSIPTALFLRSGLRVDDDEDHVLVLSCSGTAGISYLMVDGAVVASQEDHPAPDMPAQGIGWANLVDGAATSYMSELALIAGYLPPEAMRGLTIGRIRPDQNGLVGLWSHDDNGSATVTDYAPVPHNAAISGTITTDFRWVPTDQGDPSFAGKAMPTLHGLVYNRAADNARALAPIRVRYNDREAPVGTVVVRSRGGILALTTDYTLTGRGVAATVSATEPVTVTTVLEGTSPDTFTGVTADPPEAHLAHVIEDVLRVRSMLAEHVDWSAEAINAFHRLLPVRAGIVTASGQRPTVESQLGDLIEPVGAHLRLDQDGRLVPSTLLPCINPGPYGIEPLLEFGGGDDTAVRYGGELHGAALAANHSIVAIIKFPDLPMDLTRSGVTVGGIPVGMAIYDELDAGATTGAYFGVHGSVRGSLVFGHPGVPEVGTGATYVALPANSLAPGVWYLVCASFVGVALTKTRSIYARAFGRAASSWLSARQAVSSAYPVGDDIGNLVTLGGGRHGPFVGGIHRVQLWDVALDPSSALLTDQLVSPLVPSNPDLRLHFPLTDGDGSFATETVTGQRGRITGAKWGPALSIDFRETGQPQLGEIHNLTPLSSIRIGYMVNHSPMQEADIAGAITGAARVALKIPVLDVNDAATAPDDSTWQVPRIHDRDSALVRRADANAARRALALRIGPGRWIAKVENLLRAGLVLQLTDEIVIYAATDKTDPRTDMSRGRVFRLTGISTPLATLLSSLVLWDGAAVDTVRTTDRGDVRTTDAGDVRTIDTP